MLGAADARLRVARGRLRTAGELGITANHASRYMDQLRAGGAVMSFNVHRRGLHWKSDAVLDALDAFGARSSRRQFPTALS